MNSIIVQCSHLACRVCILRAVNDHSIISWLRFRSDFSTDYYDWASVAAANIQPNDGIENLVMFPYSQCMGVPNKYIRDVSYAPHAVRNFFRISMPYAIIMHVGKRAAGFTVTKAWGVHLLQHIKYYSDWTIFSPNKHQTTIVEILHWPKASSYGSQRDCDFDRFTVVRVVFHRDLFHYIWCKLKIRWLCVSN